MNKTIKNITMFKQVFDGIEVFSSGSATKPCSDNKDMTETAAIEIGMTEYNGSRRTAFPVLQLITGGISSRFFGVVPLKNKNI